MLPRSQRLSKTEFATAFGAGQTLRHPLAQVRVFKRDEGSEAIRAAFVAPRKIGGAVVRNRVRRRLRERYRLHPARLEPMWCRHLRGCDLIFLVTPAAVEASLPALDEALDQLLRRAASRAEKMVPPQHDGRHGGRRKI